MKTRAPGQPQGTPRDLSVSALILGFAATMWFGWGQSQPPPGWRLPLVIGLFAAVAVAGFAGSMVARFRGTATAMRDERVSGRYGITVGVEVAAIALGAVALGLAGRRPIRRRGSCSSSARTSFRSGGCSARLTCCGRGSCSARSPSRPR